MNSQPLIEALTRVSAYAELKEYQKKTMAKLFSLANLSSLAEMVIEEIGGDGNFASARCLAQLSGKTVRIFNPAISAAPHESDREVMPVKSCFEKAKHHHEAIDLIYGCAVLEHIQDMAGCATACHQALKPGGWLLLQGGPMWNSPYGHHLYMRIGDKLYSFDGENVAPDWCQWLYTREELQKILAEQGLEKNACEKIGWQIYESDMLNRKCSDEILAYFDNDSWELTVYENENGIPALVAQNTAINGHRGIATLYIAARKKPFSNKSSSIYAKQPAGAVMPEAEKASGITAATLQRPNGEAPLHRDAGTILRQGCAAMLQDRALAVNWTPTMMCNYQCSYCFGQEKLDRRRFTSLDSLKRAVDVLADLKRPSYDIVFSGGEPTTHPDFGALLEYCHTRLGKRLNYIQIISNGSRNVGLYERIQALAEDLPLNFLISLHMEYVDLAHIISLIATLSNTVGLSFNLMLHPEKMDLARETHSVLASLRRYFPFGLNTGVLREAPEYSKIDSRYCEADFKWADDARRKFRESENASKKGKSWYARQSRLFYWHQMNAAQENQGQIKSYDRGQYLKEGKFAFPGIWCAFGCSMIAINADGRVRGAQCAASPLKYNIFTDNPWGHEDFIACSPCPYPNCGCGANDVIPKFAKREEAMAFIASFKDGCGDAQ